MVRLGIEERTLRVAEDQQGSSTDGSVVLPNSSAAKDGNSSETHEIPFALVSPREVSLLFLL